MSSPWAPVAAVAVSATTAAVRLDLPALPAPSAPLPPWAAGLAGAALGGAVACGVVRVRSGRPDRVWARGGKGRLEKQA